MDEFAVEATAVAANGERTPFHIFVGVPEPGADGHGADCLVWCPFLDKPARIKGETPRQAYALGFDFIRQLLEYSDMKLEDNRGNRFILPSPPHEFQE